ncbi:MAG: outer membrane lipoprotein carrier protein LolA [Phycisphaerales bacterium JB040]
MRLAHAWLIGLAALALAPGSAFPQDDTPAPASPQSDPALLEELRELDARLGQLESMRARFRQTRTIPMLRRPMESSGTMLWLRGTIRWDTLEPAPSTMLVREGEIRLYYPESEILEIYQTGDAPSDADLPAVARAGASPRLTELLDRFAIARVPPERFESPPEGDMLGLELTPLADELGERVRRVLVLIDTRVPMARLVQIESADGEVTRIELDRLRFEPVVTEDELAIDVPEGTLISRPMSGELGEQPGVDRDG